MANWINRNIVCDAADLDIVCEIVEAQHFSKIVFGAAVITVVKFSDLSPFIHFRLAQGDVAGMTFDADACTVHVLGDQKAAAIKLWLNEHDPDACFGVLVDWQVSFADAGVEAAFMAGLVERAAGMRQPVEVW